MRKIFVPLVMGAAVTLALAGCSQSQTTESVPENTEVSQTESADVQESTDVEVVAPADTQADVETPVESGDVVVADDIIDTDWFAVTTPGEWRGNYTYEPIGPSNDGSGLEILGGVNVEFNGQYWSVVCYSDNWGPQGDFDIAKAGECTSYPGYSVWVTCSSEAGVDAETFTSFVVVK